MVALQERHGGADDSARLQDAAYLVHHADRVLDVLQDGLDDDGVQAAVSKRQRVTVTHHVRGRDGRDLQVQHVSCAFAFPGSEIQHTRRRSPLA